ncbi:hypothetical protein KSF_015100 [Reticulibacter mediterranei]|uniref:DUF7800 domain-containing protein n=1 Tax=Reticulibacter mediterranei TaxID=2778369 RepID=A0A8J3MZ29_9CHLR|nr:hypothetical protein [Reticulibacter mediterranei]GHO91462.1 hypothetical protein KSF_015100 [Reticulibacter mediterranei]
MSHVRIGPLVRATTTAEATIWLELSQSCIVQLQVTPYNASDSEVVTINTPTITIGGIIMRHPRLRTCNRQPGTVITSPSLDRSKPAQYFNVFAR